MNLLDDPRVYHAHQAARRATTSMTVLDLGAWAGLMAGVVFWSNFFYVMIQPALLTDWLQTLVMAVGYAIVLPMLLSTLVPSTPAGMLLQQTRARSWGFVATIGATLFLCWHALTVLQAYWASKPNAASTGQDMALAIGSLIIFVLVPALAWVQAAPDRWVAEVQSAMAVRRLKMAHEANIMAAKTQYLRTISLLRRGVANLSAQEHAELAGGLVMFQRAENEAIGTIVDTLEAMTGISTGVRILEDAELEQAYTGITRQLAGLIAEPNVDDYVEPTPGRAAVVERRPSAVEAYAPPPARSTVAHQDDDPAVRGRPHPSVVAVRSGPPRTAVDRDRAAVSTAAVVRPELTGAWARRQLEEAASCEKSKASELIRTWRELGLIDDINQPANHYAWTDPEILTQRMQEAGL